jgi:hypothetical protein
MVSFSELFERRRRAASLLLGIEQSMATYLDDEEQAEFDAIFCASLNRFRNDDFEERPNESTWTLEAMPAASERPVLSSLTWKTHADMCAFTPTCVRTCEWCARQCARQQARPCTHRPHY